MMWPRVGEVSLAIWLAMSPWIFGYYGTGDTFKMANDFICATIIGTASVICFNRKFEYMHLINIGMGVWLMGVGFVQPDPPPPAPYQNYVCVGFLLTMLAVIPSRSDSPPTAWQRYYAERGKGEETS